MERRDFLKMLAIGPLLGGALGRAETEKAAVRMEAPVENEMTVPVQDAPIDWDELDRLYNELHREFVKNAAGEKVADEIIRPSDFDGEPNPRLWVPISRAPDEGGDYITRFSGEWEQR